jgi:peptidyl-prolyl cis-trans isomerase B (cyclophilin B)
MKKILKFLILTLLVAAMAICAVSCNENDKTEENDNENLRYESKLTGEGTEIDMDAVVTLIDSRRVDDFVACDKKSDYVLVTVKDYGQFVITLRGDVAPETVKNFKKLVANGHYNSTVFNTVTKNFVIEGGGYSLSEDGAFVEKKADTVKGEFGTNGHENNLRHMRGVVSMARSADDPDSASSKFFIVQNTSVSSLKLDGSNAAFGFVVAGMEVVDAIANCESFGPEGYKRPVEDVIIESMAFVMLKK